MNNSLDYISFFTHIDSSRVSSGLTSLLFVNKRLRNVRTGANAYAGHFVVVILCFWSKYEAVHSIKVRSSMNNDKL